ncbi:MAG: sigma-54-dependent Fis family transcriptional regulator [Nitrospirae bacterium]|nr:sigma-54-dependent Fis family transcriptional regulator [Candidatus Manganitrophaceae bacterium]
MTDPSPSKPILVVDDDPAMRLALAESLRQAGHSVLIASGGEEAVALCREPIALMMTDIRMPGMNGMDLFQEVKRLKPSLPIILMSAFGTIEVAVEAMKSGAFDYLVKPFSQEALETVVRKALRAQEPSAAPWQPRPTETSAGRALLTQDPGLLKLLKTAEVVAAGQTSILIEGESGTGKELLARFIHSHSARAHRPFIAINCAAVPEALLESELFGFEKGAFTGAAARKPGRFELAHTGTLLLDEVGEMHLSLQAKLLRVLQEREVDLLGGKGPISLDIRVIAATNRPLWEEVKAGRFREDLYYRLNVFPLRLPPLRQRIVDIPLLADHFIKKGSFKNGKAVLSISPEALSHLMRQEWRGNVREFENVIERAVLLCDQGVIRPDHLLFEEAFEPKAERPALRATTVWEAERGLILETLERVGGNRTHAARLLGISIRTLRNKLKEYRTAELADPSPSGMVGVPLERQEMKEMQDIKEE